MHYCRRDCKRRRYTSPREKLSQRSSSINRTVKEPSLRVRIDRPINELRTYPQMQHKPLPLINPTHANSKHLANSLSSSSFSSDYQTGLILLLSTWSIFIISILLIFDIITVPNCLWWCDTSSSSSEDVVSDFPVENYYSYAVLLVPVMAWVWVVVSWTGLKLFKHARGGKIKTSNGKNKNK